MAARKTSARKRPARTARAKTRSGPSAVDEQMMRLALQSAKRGDGRVAPNPSVGAVVYRGNKVLGRGRTQRPGKGHAEITALAAAERKFGARALRGASIAVTLEPCCFTGKTGPCTDALLEAGIARVVAGVRDPHPKVAGAGFARLRRAGVEVVPGVLEAECAWQHRGFVSVCERGRPHLTLKLAATLDGRIATAAGESRWITGPEARAAVHSLRGRHDAVLVGSGTAIADDPELTVRRDGRVLHRPIRVVVDGGLNVPADAKLFQPAGDSRTWLLCREGARGRRAARERAAKVLEVPAGEKRRLDLAAAMKQLANEGLTTVFVEGGGQLAAALLRADLIDEVHWMLAPRLMGGDGLPVLGPLQLDRLDEMVELETLALTRRGKDWHWHAKVDRTGPAPSKLRASSGRSRKKSEPMKSGAR